MEKRNKIIIVVVIVILAATSFLWAPITLMMLTNGISSTLMDLTSDEEFERQFAEHPDIKEYIEKYPNYQTNHSREFLGWKVIMYNSEDGPSIYSKKSVIHGKMEVQIACSSMGNFSFDKNKETITRILENGCN